MVRAHCDHTDIFHITFKRQLQVDDTPTQIMSIIQN